MILKLCDAFSTKFVNLQSCSISPFAHFSSPTLLLFHHLCIIHILFPWCFIHIFDNLWCLFSSAFYRPTFSSINTSAVLLTCCSLLLLLLLAFFLPVRQFTVAPSRSTSRWKFPFLCRLFTWALCVSVGCWIEAVCFRFCWFFSLWVSETRLVIPECSPALW